MHGLTRLAILAALGAATGLTGACTGEFSFGPVDSPLPEFDFGPPVDAGPLPDFGPLDDPDADPEDRTLAVVCDRWNAEHVQNATAQSSGTELTSCTPGMATPAALDDATRRLNLYRWLNGLLPVTHNNDPGRLAAQQDCAMIMARNSALSHFPPMSWACWTEGGDEAAGSSNLSLGRRTGAGSINGFMIDNGANNAPVGHRRWFLHQRLDTVSFGIVAEEGAPGATCAHVFDVDGAPSRRPFTAFPNPGYAPFAQLGGASTRWSVQSDRIAADDFVRVTDLTDQRERPVRPDPGNGGFAAGGGIGGGVTLVWLPDGWTPTPRHRYRVVIGDLLDPSLEYETELVDCPGDPIPDPGFP
ncbi:MAG: CAP domain-containing protein [Sandaracinaceae bacterium]